MTNIDDDKDQNQKNFLEVGLGIVRPQLAPMGLRFDHPITIHSPIWQRESCVQIRRYQSRECRDGMSMDTSRECWENTETWPLTEVFYPDDENQQQGLIGALGFEKGLEFSNHHGTHVMLQFCWIHPFYRSKDRLKQMWPELCKHYGQFLVSNPRTKQMSGFLQSVGYVDYLS